jgi:hypothetical protein
MTLKRRTSGALLVGALAATGLLAATGVSARAATAPSKPAPPAATLGIYLGGSASQGQHPNILNEYYGWGDTDIGAFLNSAHSRGATPFIELEPWTQSSASNCTVSMSGIAGNTSSNVTYEKAVGTAIANFGHPVILTFAHEFNVSGQYPWAVGGGCNTSPSGWISAWKSVVTNVNSTAGQNAYWMWAPNADTGGTTQSPAPWWPGSGYVDMVGVDGYPDTEWGSQFGAFSGEFGPAFSDIRGAGWSGPIFISETNLARLDGSGYESMTGFINDLFNAGGSGVLEFEDPSWDAPTMTSQQWTELDSAIAAHTGGGTQQAPAATTNAASSVTSSGATLNGSVNPRGAATTYRFDYGTSTGYGKSTTAGSAGSGTSAVNESAHLSGLAASTTYHYRIEATNSTGTTYGADKTFTTSSSGTAAPVLCCGHVVSVNNNEAVVTWDSTVEPGTWKVTIVGPGPINGRTNTVGIPQASYSGLEAGHTYTVTVQQLDSNGGPWGASGQIVFVTTS